MELIEDRCASVIAKLNDRERSGVALRTLILDTVLRGPLTTLPNFKVPERVVLGTDDVAHGGGDVAG